MRYYKNVFYYWDEKTGEFFTDNDALIVKSFSVAGIPVSDEEPTVLHFRTYIELKDGPVTMASIDMTLGGDGETGLITYGSSSLAMGHGFPRDTDDLHLAE